MIQLIISWFSQYSNSLFVHLSPFIPHKLPSHYFNYYFDSLFSLDFIMSKLDFSNLFLVLLFIILFCQFLIQFPFCLYFFIFYLYFNHYSLTIYQLVELTHFILHLNCLSLCKTILLIFISLPYSFIMYFGHYCILNLRFPWLQY